MLRRLGAFLALNIVLLPIMVFCPLLYAVALVLAVGIPQANLSYFAELLIWIGPLSCAFYMCVSCHWNTVRKAQSEGRLSTWRDGEGGGVLVTVAKSTAYLFVGLVGSFLFEVAFASVFRISSSNQRVWFALLPFATYAPVLLLWLSRAWRCQ